MIRVALLVASALCTASVAFAQPPKKPIASAYPFANPCDAGEMPGYTVYGIPEGYVRIRLYNGCLFNDWWQERRPEWKRRSNQ